jgi:hypothetical protein
MSSEPHSDSKGSELNEDTVKLIFEITRDNPERQVADAKDLDTKMVQVFSAASVVIGLVSFADRPSQDSWWIDVLIGCLLISYGATALVAFMHLRARQFRRSLYAGNLWREAWDRTPMEIRHALIVDISEAYVHNKPILNQKGRFIQIAVVTTGVEVALVGLILLIPHLV